MRSCLPVLVALLSLASPRIARGDCAMVEYFPNPLTPAATDIGDGGIVVAQLAFAKHLPTESSTWRFRVGTKTSVPAITSIAPGLDVYRPSKRGAKLVLVGGDGKPIVELTSTKRKRAELPVPSIKAIQFSESRGRHSSASTVAELIGDPPDGVIALVAYDRTGKPRSFGTVVKNAKQVDLYNRSDCGGPFRGTVVSRTGDRIRVAWLDASGRLSKQSAPIRVR